MSEPTISSPFVFDVTTENFERDVLDRSLTVPVVIDFWAEWCGPCRMLGPVLERLAHEYNGAFYLAKLDTEKEPEIARQFGIQSIPAVFGVRDAGVVDGFVGVQSEAVIRTWLERLMPSPAERVLAEAARLEPTDPTAAQAKYTIALSLDPNLLAAHTALARIALDQGQLDTALEHMTELERQGFLEPDAEKVKAQLTLRLQAREAGVPSVAAAQARVALNPDDLDARYALAESLAAVGQYDDALAVCLELVERDRKGVGEKARQTMVSIFHLLPPDSELVMEYQRQLSMILMD
jgi:putative thioredoxin